MAARQHFKDTATFDRLDKERTRRRLTKRAFARLLDVTPQTYGQWAKRGFPHDNAKTIARKLGWTIDALLGSGSAPTVEDLVMPYVVEPDLQKRIVDAMRWLTVDQRTELADSVEREAASNRALFEQLRSTAPAARQAPADPAPTPPRTPARSRHKAT